ncbi:MAG: YfhO family protein [Bacteroidetes bacterium]|nr:YfhO family protein [Bacteroidota bacterium]
MNDAKIQGYRGTQSYYSFNQLYYVNFLQEIGIIKGTEESETRWVSGLSGIPLLHSFASIKYALTKTNKPFLLTMGYDSITTIGDVKILKNKFNLPLGFTYEKYISSKDFKKLSQNQKGFTLYKAFVINDSIYKVSSDFKKFQIQDTTKNYTWQEYESDITMLSKESLKITEHGQNKIKGNIKVEKQKMLFFSIPFDKGWSAVVDGKESKLITVDIGFMGLILSKGAHNIELNYLPPYYYEGFFISIVSLIIYFLLFFIKKKQTSAK